jgi:hypothetical protein
MIASIVDLLNNFFQPPVGTQKEDVELYVDASSGDHLFEVIFCPPPDPLPVAVASVT